MFESIGRFVDRYRFFMLAIWLAATVIVTIVAPNFDEIASNDSTDFLPSDSPSITGQTLVERYFPGLQSGGSVTLVFDAGDNAQITDPQQMEYIAEISDWLTSEDAPAAISGVQSPTLNPEAATALTSPDQQIAIALVTLDVSDPLAVEDAIVEINTRLEDNPEYITAYQTGQQAIFYDYNLSITETVDRTLVVTLSLVVIILLVIYRSPVSPFIPLTVVTIAYMLARGIIALLGDAGVFTVSGTAGMLLIVVMYGAGTDYCLFLINRFREEVAQSKDVRKSVRSTVRHVGESITSGAGTTITGFLAMASAQLGLFNTAGPTLAIGIVVSLLAGLTLTPALLGMLGERAFWPSKAVQRETGAFYKRTSQLVSSRPLLTIVVIVLAMAPFAIYGLQQKATYDTLADLPDDMASVEGFRLLETHMGAGNIQPTTVISELSTESDPIEQVQNITSQLMALSGVADVRSASQPLGGMTNSTDTSAEPTPEMMEMFQAMAAGYLNTTNGVARFDVILTDNPYSTTAMSTIEEIRAVVSAVPGEDGVTGSTAINADIRDTLQEDIRFTIGLVLVGIFIVLTVMLRSLVAPTYLIATILLSYGTTMGITYMASQILWGTDEIVWWVPFFVFVFAVALGIDYSIFLFGRIKEEVRKHGIIEGIHSAVEATGSVITSAGIIVAGTFGALMGGEILGLGQIGLAVSVGILIDTFVVRTVLDPALATFFGKWTWWPGGVQIEQTAVQSTPNHRATGEFVPDGAD